MTSCNSVTIKQVKNGWVLTSSSRSTFNIEEHIFSEFPDAMEFMMKYYDIIGTWDSLVDIQVKRDKDKHKCEKSGTCKSSSSC